ncbi:DegT/DnrJ/EryC1/StrS family aminotransferase [Rickettsiella massiliensis]|uniref:DegT/DnrJ/EryC1/StrS family aminotransferase n=1 Tax=Rickettsiella massiliensis TaxID=676517 RepID=UPI00029B0BFD|nr:DegT/DnrJ/EryC1/StrS family aminotransferase [Rickettsiella massiliensis]
MYTIPSFKSSYTQADVDALLAVVKRSMFWADSPEIDELEQNMASYLNIKHTLLFNSGTSALLTLLLALDVRNKEVICPSFTFIATVNTIELAGAIPVFADSESETFGLDAEDVEKKISDKTKAIITINYGGCICRDVKLLRALADKNDLVFIEDAAQSFSATVDGNHVGSYSDAAIFSFCQNKLITALGEGGSIVTNDRKVYEKTKGLRSHGRVDLPGNKHFDSVEDNDYLYPGYNFRMPSASAAFLNSQLKHIEKNLSKRRAIAEYYNRELSSIRDIRTPKAPKNFTHIYQMYTIRLPSNEIREGLKNHLLNQSIMVRCYFELVHIKHYFKKKYADLYLPIAQKLSQEVLTLPMFPQLLEDDLVYIIKSIKEYFSH